MGKLNAAEHDLRNEMALDGSDTSFVIADSQGLQNLRCKPRVAMERKDFTI